MIYNQNFDKRIKLNWFHYDWFVIRFARHSEALPGPVPQEVGPNFSTTLQNIIKHDLVKHEESQM